MSNESTFSKLNKLNVNEHVEKKGRFSYLSWPWAVQQLRLADPKATWTVVKYDGKPYCSTDAGHFVEVAVTVDGVTLSQVHPVLDSSNHAVKNPDAFQINTSIQRCLVKAIALHGLGLYIYAGEDLPSEDDSPIDGEQVYAMMQTHALNGSAALTAAIKKLTPAELESLTDHARKSLRAAAEKVDAEKAGQA